jgi:Predicted membrane protein
MAQRRTIGNIVAPWRFLLFLAVFAAGTPFAIAKLHNCWLGLMAAFDIAAALFLLVCAPLIASRDPALVREHAKQNDANRSGLILLTGIVMVVLLAAIAAETMKQRPEPLTKLLVVATLLLAWLFSNMVYAFHYTHLAYRGGTTASCTGLDFPDTPDPVYWDFVYFAFTIGMTFQTSDVTVSDSGIRRFVTLHSLGAFVFNIGVLAFTINVIGSG